LKPRLLLDTQILIRWLAATKKLSREQTGALREALHRHESVAVSAITLFEIAILFSEGATRSEVPAGRLFEELESNPAIQIVPMTVDVATEVAALGTSLRDPADRAIVGTARVFKYRLVTSDQRIIESKLVPVVV
jgi:PIN domain nuclease of toxin-antitoxin system